jgi:hypothetical protein
MTEQVTRYAGAKGKGDNVGLMKVKQTLPNLVANYMSARSKIHAFNSMDPPEW